jgi:hypothetical protein
MSEIATVVGEANRRFAEAEGSNTIPDCPKCGNNRQVWKNQISGCLSRLVVPSGFRLLETGERIRAGDIYCKGPAHSWHQQRRCSGLNWNADEFWPMARRNNTKGQTRGESRVV